MELKPYQLQVLNELSQFLHYLNRFGGPAAAYAEYWSDRIGPYDPILQKGMPPYIDRLNDTPHVCIKVPTAGGKTFIACNALNTLKPVMQDGPKTVVWLVPSATILEQTIRNLRDPAHPYRRQLNADFRNRVEVLSKEELLLGAGFHPNTVREHLTIMVLSFDSLRSKSKENRKIYQENSALAAFQYLDNEPNKLLHQYDPTSLINVIRMLQPVVIVDESHHAITPLSLEMLNNLNPSFVLELTATPRGNSNIISYVDAFALKKEHMVKLPVIVHNLPEKDQVIAFALQLREQLEQVAMLAKEKGTPFIRPIVLFQAEPKFDGDRTTFDKVKKQLQSLGIPDEHIKIKTATVDELKGQDLMHPENEVRFIITVNALKEGWDCPFAYVLASLADRSSDIDVEQLVGRILRQPYIREHADPMLNTSYVLTSSRKFSETLDNIVAGLNKAGFSSRDYKLLTPQQPPSKTLSPAERINLIAKRASAEQSLIQSGISQTKGKPHVVADLQRKVEVYAVKEKYAALLENLTVPQFAVPAPSAPLFNVEGHQPLHARLLLENFHINNADSNVNFGNHQQEVYQLDLEATSHDDLVLSRERIEGPFSDHLTQYLKDLSEKDQRAQLAKVMFNLVRQYRSLQDRPLRDFLQQVFSNLNAAQLVDAIGRRYEYKQLIERKIDREAAGYAKRQFLQWVTQGIITAEPLWKFPDQIIPGHTSSAIVNSLYQREGKINRFEQQVIERVAGLNNVLFWHRNLDHRKGGFALNGYFNHYPDFIVMTKQGTLILLETKGDDRDNSDSREKLKLGQTWAQLAGPKYRYFMTFSNNKLQDAWSIEETLRNIAAL